MSDLKKSHAQQRRKSGAWRFLFRSDSVALNFVSTIAGNKDRAKGADRFADASLIDRWFCEAGLPPLANAAVASDLNHTKGLREAIFRLADNRLSGREIQTADIALLNQHARTGLPTTRIACDGCTTEPPEAASVDELLGIISRDAIDIFTGPYRNRIRQCAAAGCAVIFIDRSRSGNRRWCAMSPCGDKASAKAYRQRKKHNED